ncbi:MAG: complex I subunit 1 family protein [Anaerovoracaceae bacterium]|jgi:formate hydrogenlyase subunit 4|nr:complex I subunit 1 family protein [Anaerovoracaceae bacterium]
MVKVIILVIAYLVCAPLVGGFLAGLDRKISARMQGRVGPPVLQPFYDVLKLTEKEPITVNRVQDFYVMCFFIFVLVTGGLFFAGENLLLVMFTLTLASVFLIVAAFSSTSPYAEVGAERELLQMLAYEPMVLITCVGFYMFTGSFQVGQIMLSTSMPFPYLIGLFIGFVYILTIKFRKSPFDLSMSHHAHQELVAGLKTEFSGKTLALLEAAHWYENVFLLGMVFLFFVNGQWWGYVIGGVAVVLTYFLEIVIDNSFARMKWQVALNSAWIVALVLGTVNLFMLLFV